jgi:3-dehydroquinate synthetase
MDTVVARLYGDQMRSYLDTVDAPVSLQVLDLSEQTKSVESVLDVCAMAQRQGLGRRDLLVAFGGGVCTDVVSMAASLVRRGLPYLCVPTTLLCQVDAGIGLKGGVNFRDSKNYLGCFAPPCGVLIDPTFLETLPADELRAGFAEIVKVALALDPGLFDLVRRFGPELIETGFRAPVEVGHRIIVRSIELMLDQLSSNPYEDRTLERPMDFGHTFSTRLEEVSGYQLRHGEAVSIDMALSSAVAVELGLFSECDFEIVLGTLSTLGLPTDVAQCTLSNLRQALEAAELHRDGQLNLVVPTAIGQSCFIRQMEDLPSWSLAAALARTEGFSRCISLLDTAAAVA